MALSAAAAETRAARSRRSKAEPDLAANPAAATSDVYTMAEAARLKGVSYHTVSRAVRRGKLPAQRLGRMALIAAEDLRDWRPMRERAPRKYRRREPDPGATPALLDLASGDRVALAQRLSTLYEVIHGAAGSLPLPEFLALVTDRLAAAIGLKRIAIWEVDPAAGTTGRIAAFGPPLSAVTGEIGLDDTLIPQLLAGPTPVHVVRIADFGYADPSLIYNVTDLFVAPLKSAGELSGIVVGDRLGEPFALTDDQVVMAEGLANQAALALERANLRADQVRRTAQLAAIVDSIDDAVVAFDARGALTLVNAAGRALYGAPGAEPSLGAGVEQVLAGVVRCEPTGEPLELAASPELAALRGEAVRGRLLDVVRDDGKREAVAVTAQPIRDAHGELDGAVVVARRIER